MNIGLDIMGGDFAPEAIVLGAIEARKEIPSEHDSEQKAFANPFRAISRLFVLLSNENYRSILESALPCEYSPSADCDPEERAAPAAFTFTYFVR